MKIWRRAFKAVRNAYAMDKPMKRRTKRYRKPVNALRGGRRF